MAFLDPACPRPVLQINLEYALLNIKHCVKATLHTVYLLLFHFQFNSMDVLMSNTDYIHYQSWENEMYPL